MLFKKKDKNDKRKVLKALLNSDKTILINVDKIALMELNKNVLKIFYSDQFSNCINFDDAPEAQRFFQDIEALLVS